VSSERHKPHFGRTRDLGEALPRYYFTSSGNVIQLIRHSTIPQGMGAGLGSEFHCTAEVGRHSRVRKKAQPPGNCEVLRRELPASQIELQKKTRKILAELDHLLEEYAPSWYPERLRNEVKAVLQTDAE